MKLTRLLVENILRHPEGFSWSAQGLGMLRLYLSQEVRLHIWDSALKVPGVSPIHTHPWDFRSTVIAGVIRQFRYLTDTLGEPGNRHAVHNGAWVKCNQYNGTMIKCGEEAEIVGDTQSVLLAECPIETYREGDVYAQKAEEIHRSLPDDGTVTLVERIFKTDRDHAMIYWVGKGPWMDAKPRPAMSPEVAEVTRRALETWF